MNFLDIYPEILTVEQIAEILRIKVNHVYRLTGLVRIRVGQGRGVIRFRKIDLVNYLKSKEEEVSNIDDSQEKERHRKVGVSTLRAWKKFQEIRLEYERRGAKGC